MIRWIQYKFALSKQGARDFTKAIAWCSITNLSLMFSGGLFLLVINHMIESLSNGSNPASGVWGYTGLAVGTLVVIFILHWLQYKKLYIATYDESANRRVRLAEKLRQLPLSFFGNRDLSDLTNTIMNDCNFLERAFCEFIPELFGTSISTLIIAIGLFCLDWRMGLATFGILPLALLLVIGSKRIQDKTGLKSILAKRASSDGIQECLETVRDIKACNQKERYLHGLKEKLIKTEKAEIKTELVTGVFVTSAAAFLRLGLAITVLVGAGLYESGEIRLITYLIFLIAASRIYDPLTIVLQNIAGTFMARLQIERMRKIEEQPVQSGAKSYTPNNYDLVFDHVKFSYHENESVLEDISFTAKQGEVTALVGPSGGGKSTAAKLAARFWDVNKGRILLGDVDVSTVEPETLLKSYSVVFQDVALFDGTVMDNIRLGRREASDAEVLDAAKAARCDEFIHKLPEGYQSVIGENGSTLSGGERQRISIARALLKDAPVILLDEATASLDVENESAVQAAISLLIQNKTVLIIAHRMRTVAGADKIVVLKEGKIDQQGSPVELMAQGGLYRHMVELQEKSANWQLT